MSWYNIKTMYCVTYVQHKPDPPTNIVPTNIAWLKLSGEIPTDMRIPTPLNQDCAWVKPSETHNVSTGIGLEYVWPYTRDLRNEKDQQSFYKGSGYGHKMGGYQLIYS